MRVVDLGTRFGIEMTAGGTGQIRVTEGTVQLQWPAGRRTIGAGFDCVIGPEGPRHVTPFSILALAPNDMRGGITTTTPGLQTAGAPAGASRDNAWGFSDTNEQARLGRAATESAALAGHVWVARNDLGENAPRLTTTIIGLDDARRYNVYAYYVTHDQLPWLLRAGATGGPMTTCDRAGALIQSGGSSGNIIQLRRLIILPDVAPTGGMLSIDIDDAPSSQSGDVRCFYKGLGVQAIDPPSAPATSPDQPHLPDNPPDPVNRGAKS
jgi:hypothetical protein